MYVLHIRIWLWYIDFFLVPELRHVVHGMVMTGFHMYQRNDQKNGWEHSIYSKRLVQAMEGEREKTQGPQKKRNKKKGQHRKQEEKMQRPNQKKKREKKKNSSTLREGKKIAWRKEKENEGERQMKKKRCNQRSQEKKAWKKKEKEKEGICSLYRCFLFLCHRLIYE